MNYLKIQILGTDNKENESIINSFIRSANRIDNITCKKELSSSINECFNIWNIKVNYNVKENYNISYLEYDADVITGIYSDTTSKLIIEKELYESEKIVVVIDGNCFLGQSEAEIVRLLKRRNSRYITPILTNYIELNNKDQNDLFFIVTKARKVLKKTKIQDIRKALCQSFSGFYDSENTGYVEPRTICVDCDDDLAINVPFLFFIQSISKEQNNINISNIYNKELNRYKSMLVTGFLSNLEQNDIHMSNNKKTFLIRSNNSLWMEVTAILKQYRFRQIEKKGDYIEALLFVLDNKCIWKELPLNYPSWKNVYNFYIRAKKKGALKKILRLVKKWEKENEYD